MRRVVDVIRVQTVNLPRLLAWPLGVLLIAVAFNLALFGSIGDAAPPEGRLTGALTSIYVVVGVQYVQVMTQLFPFALGLGVTRRAFYTGTVVRVVLEALSYGLLLFLLGLLEGATDGWGVQLQFFSLGILHQDDPLARWLGYVVPFLAISAVAVFAGVVFQRWGQSGVLVATAASVGLLAGAVALVTWLRWWPAVGAFLTGQSTFVLLAGYPLLIAVVLAGAGWFAIRRAAP